jgi:predicted RNase H-like nuclease
VTNADEYGRDDWRHLAEILGAKERAVQIDDLLDAIVLALTAFADGDEDRRLPPSPPSDAVGLPMQMVYRSESALVE